MCTLINLYPSARYGDIPLMPAFIPLVPTFRRLRQADFHEFKVSLVYTVKVSQGSIERLFFKQQTSQQKEKSNTLLWINV